MRFRVDTTKIELVGCCNSRFHARVEVTANEDITGLTVVPDRENIDVRILRSWYQNGAGIGKNGDLAEGNFLNAELLLRDASMVRTDTDNPMSYLKDVDGNEYSISEPTSVIPDSAVIDDADRLLPFDIAIGKTEVLYLTITNLTPGQTFRGKVFVIDGIDRVGIDIEISTLSYSLDHPKILTCVYYMQGLSGTEENPLLTNRHRISYGAMKAQLEVMKSVGIEYPTFWYSEADGTKSIEDALALRDKIGFDKKHIFCSSLRVDEGSDNDLVYRCERVLGITRGYGRTYLYGHEEVDDLSPQYQKFDITHANGCYTFLAIQRSTVHQAPGYIDMAIVDAELNSQLPLKVYADMLNDGGSIPGSYANPFIGQDTLQQRARLQYGFRTWARGYKAVFAGFIDSRVEGVNPWLDWLGAGTYRPIMAIYPTTNGCVSTLNIEEYGEAITDVRYVEKLESLIAIAPESDVKTNAVAWTEAAKVSAESIDQDSSAEMDTMRADCIEQTEALIDAIKKPSTYINSAYNR